MPVGPSRATGQVAFVVGGRQWSSLALPSYASGRSWPHPSFVVMGAAVARELSQRLSRQLFEGKRPKVPKTCGPCHGYACGRLPSYCRVRGGGRGLVVPGQAWCMKGHATIEADRDWTLPVQAQPACGCPLAKLVAADP